MELVVWSPPLSVLMVLPEWVVRRAKSENKLLVVYLGEVQLKQGGYDTVLGCWYIIPRDLFIAHFCIIPLRNLLSHTAT